MAVSCLHPNTLTYAEHPATNLEVELTLKPQGHVQPARNAIDNSGLPSHPRMRDTTTRCNRGILTPSQPSACLDVLEKKRVEMGGENVTVVLRLP